MAEKESTCETRSHASLASRASSTGAAAAIARAKAEVAKARVLFVEKEMKMKLDKAKIEAELEMLHIEKEAAAAVVEAETLEAAADQNCDRESCKLELHLTPQDPMQRTSAYVLEPSKPHSSVHTGSIPALELISKTESKYTPLGMPSLGDPIGPYPSTGNVSDHQAETSPYTEKRE